MTCSIPSADSIDPGPSVPSHRRVGHGSFAELTTMGLGGPISDLVLATTEDEIVEAVRECDEAGRPVLVMGGGSNMVAAGFDGRVVIDTRSEIEDVDVSGCGGALVRASAGTGWDDMVRYAIAHGYRGLEALSGIPGTVGACPVQNVGAYGQEVSQTISSVRVYDRKLGKRTDLALAELGLTYRNSVLKESLAEWGPTPRWVVLSVTFQFLLGSQSMPVGYAQLADHLGGQVGDRFEMTEVRRAVLELRASKGMVLDDEDRDTYSAGSFFTNPIIEPHLVPDGAPAYPHGNLVKTSAAWLMTHAGCDKGWGGHLTEGRATLSTKHSLALTNRGGATPRDILTLAAGVVDQVEETYGITLVPEPMILGESLPHGTPSQ